MKYDYNSNKMQKPFLAIMLVILFLVVAGGTLAWFTYNHIVETDKVTAAVSDEKVKLLVSTEGGDAFKGKSEAAIKQINKADKMNLMPVSTSDLETFVVNSITDENDMANVFSQDTEENNLYHGRFYIKAKATGDFEGRTLTLYLDKSKGAFFTGENQELLNASRLGLKVEGRDAEIFYLSTRSNKEEDQMNNTVVDGVLMEEGNVLTMKNGKVKPVTDPAVSINKYCISFSDEGADVPEKSLLKMELNKEYTIDVYYYLEGCDSDCTSAVSSMDGYLNLAFFGVIN